MKKTTLKEWVCSFCDADVTLIEDHTPGVFYTGKMLCSNDHKTRGIPRVRISGQDAVASYRFVK